jgi:Protein of unknown function (DUF3990)
LRSRTPWPGWNNPRIILYHGTIRRFAERIRVEGVDTSVGRPEVDFGQGFYTTTWLKQSRSWARIQSSKMGEPGAIVKLTVDRTALAHLRTLVFLRGDHETVDFWSFVEHCRNGNRRSPLMAEDYDVVYGPVASRWGPNDYEIQPGLDQISFHGSPAQELLRDSSLCAPGVIE